MGRGAEIGTGMPVLHRIICLFHVFRTESQGLQDVEKQAFTCDFSQLICNDLTIRQLYAGLFRQLFHCTVINSRNHRQLPGSGRDRLCHRWIDFTHEWQDIKPNLIAHHVINEVGTVGDIVLMNMRKKTENLVPVDTQQGAHHPITLR